jgi:MarR family
MADWSFLTNHARVLLCIAHDPGVRLRDIAAVLGITERSAFGIVNDLVAAGYVVKDRDGRRNRYQIQSHLPLREAIGREQSIGEVLAVLVNPNVPERAWRDREPRDVPIPTSGNEATAQTPRPLASRRP